MGEKLLVSGDTSSELAWSFQRPVLHCIGLVLNSKVDFVSGDHLPAVPLTPEFVGCRILGKPAEDTSQCGI